MNSPRKIVALFRKRFQNSNEKEHGIKSALNIAFSVSLPISRMETRTSTDRQGKMEG